LRAGGVKERRYLPMFRRARFLNMSVSWLITTALISASVWMSAGCQPARTPRATPTTEVTIVTSEFKFSPNTLTVKAGERVRVTFDNSQGALKHDLKQAKLNIAVSAESRQKTTFEFDATTTGTFEFICSLAGHKEAGMVGQIVIQ
jgi:uncharacterized cupredoxin-like copper-binding protein